MVVLLVIKERLKAIYAVWADLINGVVKFTLSYFALWLLKENLGYMVIFNSNVTMLGISFVCALLPYSLINFVIAGILLAHIWVVSMEVTILLAALIFMIGLLYFGIQPGTSCWFLLTPIAFVLKIPYLVPLIAGLVSGVATVIPVSFGILVYYIVVYVKTNAGVLANNTATEITQKYQQMVSVLFINKEMMMMMVACAVGLWVVRLLRKLSVDYAWIIAIGIGAVLQLAVIFTGEIVFDIPVSIGTVISSLFISILLAFGYHFFVFAVDYTRTEYLQFEDDEYVYYVKAVPKVAVSKPDVHVRKINHVEKHRHNTKIASSK